MPQTPERKQAYMREYKPSWRQRRREGRDSLSKAGKSRQEPPYYPPKGTTRDYHPHTKREDGSPFPPIASSEFTAEGRFTWPMSHWAGVDYGVLLAQRGYGLAKTSLGYEFVNLATAELGLVGTGEPHQAVHDTQAERIAALEQRLLVLEVKKTLEEMPYGL